MSLASSIIERAIAAGLRIATAESCTGGLIAGALTGPPGASRAFTHGFVTYANAAKTDLLGVPGHLIARKGAVSAEVARAMAAGALRRSGADIALATTGIAGPGGATPGKPLGLVYIALAGPGGRVRVWRHRFRGGRDAVRAATVSAALGHLAGAMTAHPGARVACRTGGRYLGAHA
ncbi:MAG: CinA family protein [Alphaproteobacteria bacterium]|nr:CinA family protein [Alphaproteobacteria bacterium]